MSNQFDYPCPQCGSADTIDVCASVWVRLVPDGTDADESENGGHEWGAESPAQCGACGHGGTVKDFDLDAGDGK